MAIVSDEAVAEHLPKVAKYARMMTGWGGAEYDDLYQEGSLKVFLLLQEERPITSTAVKNAMLDWVRFCRRRGFAYPLEEGLLEIEATWADRHGRQKAVLGENSNSVWATVGYAPE